MENIQPIHAQRGIPRAGLAILELIDLVCEGIDRLGSGARALLARHRDAVARAEMHALSDHMLRDIGVRRDQIDELFR